LADSLKDINLTLQTFKRHLKTFLFLHTTTFSAFKVSYKNALYKSTVITNYSLSEKRNSIFCGTTDSRYPWLQRCWRRMHKNSGVRTGPGLLLVVVRFHQTKFLDTIDDGLGVVKPAA